MFKKTLGLYLIVTVIFLIADTLQAQNILIWDNDNSSHYYDSEEGESRNCEYGIQRALTDNQVSYVTRSNLPLDISDYDIVFVVLGVYCVG